MPVVHARVEAREEKNEHQLVQNENNASERACWQKQTQERESCCLKVSMQTEPPLRGKARPTEATA